MGREAVAFGQVWHEAGQFADVTSGMGIGHADAAPQDVLDQHTVEHHGGQRPIADIDASYLTQRHEMNVLS